MLFLLIFAAFVCLVLIIKGADIFLNSSIYIAKKTGMSQVLIGATIVSVGTTLPEITVSIIAAIKGDFSLSVTNALGSIFCNTAFILGVAFMCVSTVLIKKEFSKKIIFLIVTVLLILIFSLLGVFNMYEALGLLCIFLVYIIYNIYQAKTPQPDLIVENKPDSIIEENKGKPVKVKKICVVVLFFILGALMLGVGAYFLVEVITRISIDYLGISTGILGVTVVALGTSLPEFITAITAVKKKSVQISIGNIIGANIINGTFILGICGLIGGQFNINAQDTLYIATNGNISSAVLCAILCFAVILIAFVPILIKGKTFKWQGYILVSVYIAYILYLVLSIALN